MKKKKRYYPNKWRALKNAPDEAFESIDFEDFMEWKMQGWEIPPSIACIIREKDLESGKVNEYTYTLFSAAMKRAKKIMDAGNEYTVCTHHELAHMHPEYLNDDYD